MLEHLVSFVVTTTFFLDVEMIMSASYVLWLQEVHLTFFYFLDTALFDDAADEVFLEALIRDVFELLNQI